MDARRRIDEALSAALSSAEAGAPPRIAAALWHSVFPGGGRLRPRLTLAVARACGEDTPALTVNAAASIELMHCASLVHDDLPCFDNGLTRAAGARRCIAAFGEPLAVLAGDALIVHGVRDAGPRRRPRRTASPGDPGSSASSGARSGMPGGIVAGQAWECEPFARPVGVSQGEDRHVLFAAATASGAAAAAGWDPAAWWLLGERLGEAYQVADDIRDVRGRIRRRLGKPVGRDKPRSAVSSAVGDLGLEGALDRFSTGSSRRSRSRRSRRAGDRPTLEGAPSSPRAGRFVPQGGRAAGRMTASADDPAVATRTLRADQAASRRSRLLGWRDRHPRVAAISPPLLARFPPILSDDRATPVAAGLFDLCAGFVYSQVLAASRSSSGCFEHPRRGSRFQGRRDRCRRTSRSDATRPTRTAHGGCGRGPWAASIGAGPGPVRPRASSARRCLGNPGVAAMVAHRHRPSTATSPIPVALLRRRRSDATRPCRTSGPTAGAASAAGGRRSGPSATRGSWRSRSRSSPSRSSTPIRSPGTARSSMSAAATGAFLASAASRRASRPATRAVRPAGQWQRSPQQRFERDVPAGRSAHGGRRRACGPTRCRRGSDLVSLVRVIHDHDDRPSRFAILRKAVRAALPSGRDAASRRTDERHRRGRARGRRLFRLLPHGDGKRPTARSGRADRAAPIGRIRRGPVAGDAHSAHDQHFSRNERGMSVN